MFDNQGMGLPNLEGGKIQAGQGIYEVSATQVCDLGRKLVLGDREYRYSKANADTALTIGTVQSSPAEVADYKLLVAAVTAANLNKVTVTLGSTALTVDLLKDGHLFIEGVAIGDGWGQCYRIKSHPAADALATCEITLYDSIVTALKVTSDVSLLVNKYNGTLIFPHTSQAGIAIGVTPRAVPVSNYYWMQVKGPAAVLADEAAAAYTPLVPGSGVDGALEAFDADGTLEQVIAIAGADLVDGDYCPVDLKIG